MEILISILWKILDIFMSILLSTIFPLIVIFVYIGNAIWYKNLRVKFKMNEQDHYPDSLGTHLADLYHDAWVFLIQKP